MVTRNAESSTEPRSDGSLGSRRSRVIRRIVWIVVVILVLAYGAIGWIVSGRIITTGIKGSVHVVEYDTDVIAVNDTEITIGVSDESDVPADTHLAADR